MNSNLMCFRENAIQIFVINKDKETDMLYLGIDPGKNGAIAALTENGYFFDIADLSDIEGDIWIALSKFDFVKLVTIERVGAFPEQGRTSIFNFGQIYGMIKMAMAAKGWRYQTVAPVKWRKILDSSVPAKPSKEDLRAFALRRWPEAKNFLARKKDHNRAEALILAYYGYITDRN